MPQEAISFITPVGRVIWGSIHERATEDYDGKAYEPGKGPYQFGLAIRKDDPGVGDMLTKIYTQAMAGYATNAGLQQRIGQEWQSGFAGLSFRFKIKDGDKPNAQGQHNPNSAGCWVFSMQTSLDFKACNAQNVEVDKKSIERGYFVDVHLGVKVNDNVDATAGVYLNPNVVRLIAYGEKIVGGISIEDAFKGHAAPVALPPGASATPLAPANGMPAMPGASGAAPQVANPAVPQVAALPTPIASPSSAPALPGAPGQVAAQPHTAFVNGLPPLPGQ